MNLTEEDIKVIRAKKYITVKEFTQIYSYSSDWQRNRRSRLYDHLPFIQIIRGGKITYDVEKVENWFENNTISR